MSDTLLAFVYFVGLLLAEFLRWRYRWARASSSSKTRVAEHRIAWAERLVLASILIGIWILPLLYLATNWLEPFDYPLPVGLSLFGVSIFCVGLWLRYRSQKDLEDNWSPSLVIWEGQELVTKGIYGWIRHPLYAALALWGIAQPLLLHNWAAGFAGLIAAGLVIQVRLPREEVMLVNHFGEAYEDYRQRTGAIFPRRRPRGAGALKGQDNGS